MKLEFKEDPTYRICKREFVVTLTFWIIQSILMIGIFYFLGYNVEACPLDYPLGLPAWYLFGGVAVALLSLPVLIYIVLRYFKNFPLN